jgi:hypothetical protein
MDAKARALTRWVVILTGIGSLMAALDTLAVSTALSKIRLDLGASVEQLEWTVNAYNLSFAVLLITAAALGDRFGRRRLFAAGLGLFAAASAVSAVALTSACLSARGTGRRVGPDHAAWPRSAHPGVPARVLDQAHMQHGMHTHWCRQGGAHMAEGRRLLAMRVV